MFELARCLNLSERKLIKFRAFPSRMPSRSLRNIHWNRNFYERGSKAKSRTANIITRITELSKRQTIVCQWFPRFYTVVCG